MTKPPPQSIRKTTVQNMQTIVIEHKSTGKLEKGIQLILKRGDTIEEHVLNLEEAGKLAVEMFARIAVELPGTHPKRGTFLEFIETHFTPVQTVDISPNN